MTTQSRVSFWKACVLESVGSHGGVAELQEIYLWIEASDWLGEQDKRDWEDGRPMYQNSVRACISMMVKNGDLARVSRGRYRIRNGGVGVGGDQDG